MVKRQLRITCVLLILSGSCLSDNPCPVERLPPGTRLLAAVSVASAQIPKPIAESARSLIPKEYSIAGAHKVQMPGEAIWFVSVTNCCDGPAAGWQHRMVVVEESGGKPQPFPVKLADGSPAALVEFAAAYLLEGKLYVISEYFARGRCFEGKMFRTGKEYRYVRVEKPLISDQTSRATVRLLLNLLKFPHQ